MNRTSSVSDSWTFTADLRDLLLTRCRDHDLPTYPTAKRHAAIAIIIGADQDGEDSWFILTKRAAKLRRHAKQWALPGGRIDEGETPYEAAIREAKEEIDLTLTKDHCLGELPSYLTQTGFLMTPFLFWIDAGPTLTADPVEVDEIFTIPLALLAADDAVVMINDLEDAPPLLRLYVGENRIHAPTGALLYRLRQSILLGDHAPLPRFREPGWAK